MQTTLNAIRSKSPCSSGWSKLLATLNKTKADDEVLEFKTILESNGLDDAIWCLRALEGKDKEIRLFTVFCVKQVKHLLKDQRSLNAIEVAEKFANGEATKKELEKAYAARAGYAAAYAAAYAARAAYAAYAPAYAAAYSAAYAAAYAARAAAAYAPAYAAAYAAYAAAYAAARKEQEKEFIRVFC